MSPETATTTLKVISESNTWSAILISSFCGAFFAFIFVKIGDVLSRVSLRKKKGHDALVRLEHIGNENLSIAHNLIFVAKDIVDTSNKTIETNNIYVNFND